MTKYFLSLLFLGSTFLVNAQSSSEILESLERFKSFGTVLYMAAHPDDENTRVIAWLANGEHAKTGYLSLTRGDGGQNLIGDEFGDALGILRTQELLAARNIDGGEQFFTRALDFGYSRSADETLEKWDEEQVLADVVWVIRKFKPQIIITRFPPNAYAGHGHHTASAMLAIQGAEAASNPNKFPEQLKFVDPWQVQSVYWNASTWWDKTLPEKAEGNDSIWKANIGGFNANLGVNYNELGSLARSQHKCQGFGVAIDRGETFEYFQHLWGEVLPNGIRDVEKTSWSDLGAEKVPSLTAVFLSEFNPLNPSRSLEVLTGIYKELGKIEDAYWRKRKQEECAELIKMCGGFFAEAMADNYAYADNTASVTVNLLARSTNNFAVDGFEAPGGGMVFKSAVELPENRVLTYQFDVSLPEQTSNPYWLQERHNNGGEHNEMYMVYDQQLIGNAQNSALVSVKTRLSLNDVSIPLEIPVRYKWRDRVEGEQQRDVIKVPALTINFDQPMVVFLNGETVDVQARIKWFQDSGTYKVDFKALGWDIEFPDSDSPKPKQLGLKAKGFEKEEFITIRLTPQKGAQQGVLEAATTAGNVHSYQEIAYAHIPTQAYMPKAKVMLTNLNVTTIGERVAYIQGAGDGVADGIAQMGYAVDILDEKTLPQADLSQYQAIVVGIRAYNTQPWLQNYTSKIFEYIEQGGNFIVQYNTASRFLQDEPLIPSPYPFELGRGRVTEEDSDVEFLLPEHPVFNSPNKLGQVDFENWVQERGLYFASSWDEHFAAPIGWNDTGREQEQGALIIADYGEGSFMYTGISFFRVLPSGQPGPFKLLANLISYEAKTNNK